MTSRRTQARIAANRMLRTPPQRLAHHIPFHSHTAGKAWALAVIRRNGGRCVRLYRSRFCELVGEAWFYREQGLVERLFNIKQSLREFPRGNSEHDMERRRAT